MTAQRVPATVIVPTLSTAPPVPEVDALFWTFLPPASRAGAERAHRPPAPRMPLTTDEIGRVELFRQQQPDVVVRQQHLELRGKWSQLIVLRA